MFEMTEFAADQVRVAARMGGTEGMALRMDAREKEDGTIDYLMGFDEAKDEDIQINSNGIDVVIGPEAVPLLDEAVMDFVEMDDGQSRFIFLNPKDANYSPPTED
ncbi:HesB/IscA family protein [Solemya velesiana gill symbiont]|uniref:Adhesin n=1 Tax=Solemya velesiana gill symbiont TaxID=1918948 RepID=A0A1T2KX96_9GAMM|nr:iron-sulfur cluster assembly accessory protein [Solemya velesiana gill symbiont]OOZ37463.1 adhesin [Solemya velesiana gill symbiont]